MAASAGCDVRQEGVVKPGAHVTGHTTVFHGGGMRRRLASDSTSAIHAQDHGGNRAVMRTKVGAGNLDLAIYCGREGAARLVAVGAQITLAFIKGCSRDGNHCHRGNSRQA